MASPIPHARRVTTGLVGLAKVANPREVLVGLYTQTLDVLKKMPTTAHYRSSTEALTTQRLSHVQTAETVDDFEGAIGQGQAEQLISQASTELELAGKMLEWQPWQPLEEQPVSGQWKFP